MGCKLSFAFLLLSLQLLNFVTSNETRVSQSNEVDTCVSNCNNFPIRIGNKLYRLESALTVNWYQAANNCRKLGGYLLNVESSVEMDLISAITPSDNYWISSNCLSEDMQFISLTTGIAMPYNRWKPGQPSKKTNDENWNCVQIEKGALTVQNCAKLLNYICQANIL